MSDEPKTETAEAARPANTAVAMPRAPLRGGAPVVAIIPTDLEQVWRIATMAVNGAMAPDSLLKEKGGAWKPLNDAISACAIAIMAGAEMGLTPLAALRSYAVVNGRPTLWGDGIKAVVRQSGLCDYIKTGSDETKGWCEAKRKDTGEVQRKEFTLKQAERARLTSKAGPWKDYPDQMLERRATFRCLNDLFADVLAGIVSAEEATDYAPLGDDAPPRQIAPTPPEPPADEPEGQVIEPITVNNTVMAESVPTIDHEAFGIALAGAHTADALKAVWTEFNAPMDDERAVYMHSEALARVQREEATAAVQKDLLADDFPGDR